MHLLNTTLYLAEAVAGALHRDRGPAAFSDVVRQLVDIHQPAMAERRHEVTTYVEERVGCILAKKLSAARPTDSALERAGQCRLSFLPEG